MSPKIVQFLVILSIFFPFGPGFAYQQVNRSDIVCASLDAIQYRIEHRQTLAQKKEQQPKQNIFSDFSLNSPILDILSFYRRSAWPVSCFADDQYRSYQHYAPLPKIAEEARHHWDLGFELSHIKYEEPDVMEEEGTMYGVSGAYTSRGEYFFQNFMLKFEGKASWGEVDYQNSGTLNDIDDLMLEFRGLGGRSFSLFDTFMCTPYFGFGYRYLLDDLDGLTSSTGALGYERESNYYYSPVGLELLTKLQPGWFWGLTLEYDHFWMGEQESHLSDVNTAFDDLKNDQNTGYGLRLSTKLEGRTEAIDFIFEPFIKYWRIAESEKEAVSYAGVIWGLGYEPKNNSTEIGGKIGIRF
ncbi:outer membrane beta-barrel protein [Candidatus Omnitrophota bacterium]